MSFINKIKNFKKENQESENQVIEVSNKHLVLRIVLFVTFLGLGISGIVVGCTYDSTHLDAGWHAIESIEGENDSQNFTFIRYFSGGKKDNSNELKLITSNYSNLCNNAYKLFNSYKAFDGVYNIPYLNAHLNVDVQIEPELYKAFKTVLDNDCKVLYYGPLYSTYSNLFKSSTDEEAKSFDPYFNDEIASYFDEFTTFVDNGDIELVLKENNVVSLNVSDAFKAYCENNNENNYISFNYLYNAVCIDYIADNLIASNVNDFKICSYDGYYRNNLVSSELSDTYLARTFYNNYIVNDATVTFKGVVSMVELKNFPILAGVEDYYLYDDKTLVHHFINEDGFYSSCVSNINIYKNESTSVLEMLVKGSKIFVSSSLDVNALKEVGNFFYNDGNVIKYNDSNLDISNLMQNESMNFTKELI